jgi:hypothetical protein
VSHHIYVGLLIEFEYWLFMHHLEQASPLCPLISLTTFIKRSYFRIFKFGCKGMLCVAHVSLYLRGDSTTLDIILSFVQFFENVLVGLLQLNLDRIDYNSVSEARLNFHY